MFRSYLETPIGLVLIEASDSHLTSCTFADEPAQERANGVTSIARLQLSQYFSGHRKTFDIPLQPEGTAFQKHVWNEVMKIPFSKTISYVNLSTTLGDAKAVRAVAGANAKNPLAIFIPCHRVLGKDGSLTGYAWGMDKKEWLLHHEGAIQPMLF